MKRKVYFIILMFITFNIYAQNVITGIVYDEHTHENIIGANIIILGSSLGGATNIEGRFTIDNIPDGKQVLMFSHIGYKECTIELVFPLDDNYLEVELASESEEIEEIFVNATRSSCTIDAEPTRVEVIAGEEIDEKISMDPSNISMILNESTGIQVQQTSAASANNVFRIQGLDGKYTQLLKDGFPLYGGFSGSLSLVQIPPLDLKQVEIIKGSSSTLYGGGAIAGLINLISKDPNDKGELSFLVNATSALGLDLSGFYSKRFEKYGITILASQNTQKVYDNNNDDFSDIPQIERYTLNPKFYFYIDDYQSLEIGGSLSKEKRIGGSLKAVNNSEDRGSYYFEENFSNRLSSQVKYNYTFGMSSLTAKNSISYFNRELNLADYTFEGNQVSTFSEIVYNTKFERTGDWLFGLNLQTEKFSDNSGNTIEHNYSDITYGSFVQNNIELAEPISLETGLRIDYNNDYGLFTLPRINFLFDITGNVKSRVGGGLGYKIPSVFTEKSDELAFRNILPLDKNNSKAERSFGLNLDVDYKTILLDKLTFSVNNLFFYTRIDNPLYLHYENELNAYKYFSHDGFIDTRGIETNVKFTYGHYKLFAGYTYTEVLNNKDGKTSDFPLTPKHSLGIVLIYELHGNLRIGLEGYYTGKQKFSNGVNTDDYWVNGIMIEKRFGNMRFFLNFENMFDTRQSRFGPMYSGSAKSPDFAELYAPTDGRIINGGVKISL